MSDFPPATNTSAAGDAFGGFARCEGDSGSTEPPQHAEGDADDHTGHDDGHQPHELVRFQLEITVRGHVGSIAGSTAAIA